VGHLTDCAQSLYVSEKPAAPYGTH